MKVKDENKRDKPVKILSNMESLLMTCAGIITNYLFTYLNRYFIIIIYLKVTRMRISILK